MNKIYLVNHCFDVDGGFGDAIPNKKLFVVLIIEKMPIDL